MGLALRAWAGESCLPSYTALQLETRVQGDQAESLAYYLQAKRGDEVFQSKVILAGETDASHPRSLPLEIEFDPKFQGVSLPYNLYAVLIVLDGEIVEWLDFTSSCVGPGVSIFPGQKISLPEVKLIGDKPQKLQIMVWGRL
jgi:hypothetical protein